MNNIVHGKPASFVILESKYENSDSRTVPLNPRLLPLVKVVRDWLSTKRRGTISLMQAEVTS